MQCLALDDATGMAQSIHEGGQLEVRYQAVEDRTVLPEDCSIALGNLHVHSPIPRCLAGMASSGMLCLQGHAVLDFALPSSGLRPLPPWRGKGGMGGRSTAWALPQPSPPPLPSPVSRGGQRRTGVGPEH